MTSIVHLTWEYPPRVFGGLGRHVHALAEEQARAGHDVVVITPHADDAPAREVIAGVDVIRVRRDPPYVPFDVERLMVWALGFESAAARAAIELGITPDVVHAHDWHVAHAAAAVRASSGAVFALTIHATEGGRHRGWITSELSRQIHSVEWWAAHEADVLIACSGAMESEIERLFGVSHLDIIPNGVDVTSLTPRTRGREIVFLGRLEWEKGVQTLVEALGILRRQRTPFTAVVAGTGTFEPELRALVAREGLTDAVRFEGWMSESDKRAMLGSAGAIVVPSFYEPFGIVALEAVEAGGPVVVSDTGGLREIAQTIPGVAAFPAGDAVALAQVLGDVLDSSYDAGAARTALREHYSWEGIAQRTVDAYRRASRRTDPTHYVEPSQDRSVLD